MVGGCDIIKYYKKGHSFHKAENPCYRRCFGNQNGSVANMSSLKMTIPLHFTCIIEIAKIKGDIGCMRVFRITLTVVFSLKLMQNDVKFQYF